MRGTRVAAREPTATTAGVVQRYRFALHAPHGGRRRQAAAGGGRRWQAVAGGGRLRQAVAGCGWRCRRSPCRKPISSEGGTLTIMGFTPGRMCPWNSSHRANRRAPAVPAAAKPREPRARHAATPSFPTSRGKIPVLRGARHRGAGAARAQCRHHPGGDRHRLSGRRGGAADLCKDAGADVKGERVRFPRGMCRTIVRRSAPREFTQYARNPARNVVIGGNRTVFAPAYGSPFVRNLDEGRRYARIEDFRNFVKLAYMATSLHHSGGTICEPVDLPVNKRHFDMVYSHMKYSDKPYMGSVTHPERARRHGRDDEDPVRRRVHGSRHRQAARPASSA